MISSSKIGIIATIVIVFVFVGIAANSNSYPKSVTGEITKFKKDVTVAESQLLSLPVEKVKAGTDPFADIAAKVVAKNPSLDEIKQQEHTAQLKTISEEKTQEQQFKDSFQEYK